MMDIGSTTSSLPSAAMTAVVTLQYNGVQRKVKALIDTGAEGMVYLQPSIAHDLACRSKMPILATKKPFSIQGYQGGTSQQISRYCKPTLRLSNLVDNAAPVYLAEVGKHEMIIGHGYLAKCGATLDVANSLVSFAKLAAVAGHTQAAAPPALDVAVVSAAQFNRIAKEPRTREVFSLSIQAIEDSSTATTQIPKEYQAFADVFSKADSDKLPPRRSYDHKLELVEGADRNIGYSPLRRMSQDELDEVKRYIDENMDKGFITASSACVASPVLFVRKANGGLRFCVDYRKLNGITKKDRYPLPLIDETLGQLQGARFFTKLDIRQAFHRIRMDAASEDLTTFRTRFGAYKYRVMPFGLTNGPATWQHFMNDVLFDFLNRFAVAYMDDILVYSATLAEHRKHVAQVLGRLRKHALQVDLAKCEFHVNETRYLGLVVGQNGIRLDPEKIKPLQDWQPPTTLRDLQAFLGFCNYYRRFLRGYSSLARPLTSLLKKDVKFVWGLAQQQAFDTLRHAISSAPVLVHFDRTKPTRVETDSSDWTAGGVLSQKNGDGLWHPVAFYSKQLIPAECNYNIYDKELLAIVRALETWRPELTSCDTPFEIFTDHQMLQHFNATKKLTRRQVRWAEVLSQFKFEIQYRPGSANVCADALSRRPQDRPADNSDPRLAVQHQTVITNAMLAPAIRPEFSVAPVEASEEPQDSEVPLPERVLLANQSEPTWEAQRLQPTAPFSVDANRVLRHKGRIVVPATLVTDLIHHIHTQPASGHPGRKRTLDMVRRRYFWKGLSKDVAQYIRNCHGCRRANPANSAYQGLLRPLPVPDQPWQDISVDFVGPLPESQGFNTVMVVVDRLSKMRHYIPCKAGASGLDAPSVARLFLDNVWKLHGLPLSVVSDRGSVFVSHFWTHLCALLGVRRKLSTAYHPETDGQTESANKEMERFLRHYVAYAQDDWAAWLAVGEFAANYHPSKATEQAPFVTVTGCLPRMDFDAAPPTTTPASTNERLQRENASQFRTSMQQVWTAARGAMVRAQETQAAYANRRRTPSDIAAGDLVWLSTKNLSTDRPSRKLDHRMVGPFSVISVHGNACTLDLPPSYHVHPVFHTSLLAKDPADPLPGQHPPPPPHVVVEDHDEYEVEEILAARRHRGRLQFRVSWRGYPPDPAWHDADDGQFEGAANVVADFWAKNPGTSRLRRSR